MIVIESGYYFFGYYLQITNTLSKPLIIDIHGQDDEGFKRITSLFGLLFSVGALVGLIFEEWFFRMIGKMKLVVVLEALHFTS